MQKLRREMGITKKQMHQINQFVKNYYKKLEPTHGIEHLKRTVKLTVYLAKKEKANVQIAKFGAMFHQFHNGKIVRRFLKKVKVDKEIIDQVVYCVEYSSMKNILKSKPKTIEAKVVYDADKLQVIGPFGIIREICCNITARNMSFRKALKRARIIEQKCFETLQTKTAKKLAKKPHNHIIKFWKMFDKWNMVKL